MENKTYETEIGESLITNVHCSSMSITPEKKIPLKEFYKEIESLDFYEHGSTRGRGWSAVTLYGMGEHMTDHHSKYGIETPVNDWCLEDKAPIITKYFKENFFSNMKYKRIRIMRLDPGGVIRPHNDNEKNTLSNAINIELGPEKPCFTMLTMIGQQNLHLWPGRVYLFNNHFYHAVMNNSDTYRYQIIVHADNMKEMRNELIRSKESFVRGVWRDNNANIEAAVWYSVGKKKGTGCENVPYITDTLDELKKHNKKGLFLNGRFKNKTIVKGKPLHLFFDEWRKSNKDTIQTDLFCLWNPDKPDPISLDYTVRKPKESIGYWTYTTDALVEYVSSNSINYDIDLVIGPSTGTNLEHLGITYNCDKFLAFNYNEESNKIHKAIRDKFRFEEYEFRSWEAWEKETRKQCNKYKFDCHTVISANSPTRRLFVNINPFAFVDKVYNGIYDYILIDIINNPEKLLPYIKNKKIVINTSNIYGYVDMLDMYSLQELKDSWNRLMNVLKQAEYCYFIGEDYWKVNKRMFIK
jgi:hypothetical protein